MRRHLVCITASLAVSLLPACSSSSTTTHDSGTGPGDTGTGKDSGKGGSDSGKGSDGGSKHDTGSSDSGGADSGVDATQEGGGMTGDTGVDAPVATWTAITLKDESYDGNSVPHGDDTVDAIWFGDLTHGVAGTYSTSAGVAGSLQSLSGPTTISKIAYTGYNSGFSGQSADFIALFPTPTGLVAAGTFGNQFIFSTDKGLSFTEKERGDSNSGNIPAIWVSADTAGGWHWIDDVGNVWLTSMTPGPTASWNVTYQTGGSNPVPSPLPAGDCTDVFHQGYFAFDAQQVAYVSPDGQTMFYGKGYGSENAGVCRSTDGGHNFLPVDFPNPPAAAAQDVPYVIVFTDPMHGFAAHANDLTDGAYVYTTADGGKTWTAGTLPATINAVGASTYFSGGFGAPDGQHLWIVGGNLKGDAVAVLLKSKDGGKTWSDISGTLGANPAAHAKFHTGFALDANHIWVGGEHGGFLASSTGGE